jgi:hypothetical protein
LALNVVRRDAAICPEPGVNRKSLVLAANDVDDPEQKSRLLARAASTKPGIVTRLL